jgi:23S rRNA (guanosine2251-2'-O)-methyltransferase
MKTEILYGIHPVTEALKAGRRKFFELYVEKGKSSGRPGEIKLSLEKRKIPVREVGRAELEDISGTDFHQGIGAKVSEYPVVPLELLLQSKGSGSMDFLVLLDNMVDPQNFGALVRTALCVGACGIVITKDRSASPTPSVSKASAGALEHMPVSRTVNMVRAMREMKEKGFWIAGLDALGGISLYDCDLSFPAAIVIGGEGKGIRPLVKSNCDFLVSIPQKRKISSLNASVAGAVVMYEVFRRRNCGIKEGKGSGIQCAR